MKSTVRALCFSFSSWLDLALSCRLMIPCWRSTWPGKSIAPWAGRMSSGCRASRPRRSLFLNQRLDELNFKLTKPSINRAEIQR
jgi:hypothetical protein